MQGASFLSAARFDGQLCRDMYGDLAYGVFVLPQATVRGTTGYIFQGNTPILEQNADFLRHKKFLQPRFEAISNHSENTLRVRDLVSLTSRRHNCFWHWMMDSLPKVVLAEESGFKGSYHIPSPTVAPWASESLTTIGIPRDRILINEGGDIEAEQLYIPTYFCGYNAHHNLPFARFFREEIRSRVMGEAATSKQLIFVGRKPAVQHRRVLNQDELAAVASTFGFSIVFFEDLSLREQLALSCASKAIIGGHGSGLTHALFMEEGSSLIELFPYLRRQTNDCYEQLSRIPGHQYQALESERDCGSDIVLSAESLRRTLKNTPLSN